MERKCKRCAECERKDGEYYCSVDDAHVDPESRPRLLDGLCWKKRDKKSPAELSALRSEIGRRGGLAKGRKCKKLTRVQIQSHKQDHDVLAAYGAKKGLTIVGVLHFLCRIILQKHPDIPKPEGWID